jgi:hypothetical protein
MTKISIDNKGKPFRLHGEGDDQAYGEISDVSGFFWRITHQLVRELLSSPTGGTISISIPAHATSAEVDLTLNPPPVAHPQIEGVMPVNQVDGVATPVNQNECFGLSLHVEASGNGFNALPSAHETPDPVRAERF